MPLRLLRRPALHAAAALILLLGAFAAQANPLQTDNERKFMVRSEQSAEDSLFALEQAVIGKGLKIAYHSHFGDMLARTREDVGSDKVLFTKADLLVFCSATLTRKMIEAEITDISFCPYTIFVFERPEEPGASYVGFRRLSGPEDGPDSPKGIIDAMLTEIAQEAAGL